MKKLALIALLLGFVGCDENNNHNHFIVEEFSCDVAIADFKELSRAVADTDKNDFKYNIFKDELKSVTKALSKSNCEVL